MILFGTRKFFHLLHSAEHSPINFFPSRLSILFPYCSTSEIPSAKPTFIVDYLISKVGLSRETAIKSSKPISYLKSPSNPDSVLQFLKATGFNDVQIKRMVSKNPRILASMVDKTLKPKIADLTDFGFSQSEILELVSGNTAILSCSSIQPKIEFWRNFLGSNKHLLRILRRGKRLLSVNVNANVIPKITFFRGCGFSDLRIAQMIYRNPNFMAFNLDVIKRRMNLAEQLSFPLGSPKFFQAFPSLCQISKTTLESKLKLMRSFGWNEVDIYMVIRRAPNLLDYSEKKITVMLEFFVKRAGLDPSFVMRHPQLLTFSLERRANPRLHVLQLLNLKNLLKRKLNFYSFMCLSEEKFLEKYVLSYREEMPELHRDYLALIANNSTA